MTIKEFISAAIEGGWDNTRVSSIWFRQDTGEMILNLFTRADLSQLLLDPEAWKAVGRSKGWKQGYAPDLECKEYEMAEEWQFKMYMMLSELIKGKNLEEYIATL